MSSLDHNLVEQSLGALADDWPFPIFLLSRDDAAILWANQGAQEWLGQSLRGLHLKTLDAILETDMSTPDIYARCQAAGAPISLRGCILKREGREEQRCHLTAFPTESGIGLGVQIIGANPHETKVGGQLVSGMGRMIAHELKNPLAGIKGAAQLLRDDVATEEGRTLIDLISSEIDRIRRLADRMEVLGDQDPANAETVNIHEILRRARRIIQSANPNLVFTESYDPSLPHALGDSDSLMQAVLNLIKNAAEAIENTGKLGEIKLETAFRSGVKRRAKDESDKVQYLPIEIRIIDNGPGIPDDIRDQLFQPFVTSKHGGQGLGLALVSKVASAHGGIVELRSRPGYTKFSLLLPIPNGDTI